MWPAQYCKQEGEKEQKLLYTSDLERERNKSSEQADKLRSQTLEMQQLHQESDRAVSRALSTLQEQLLSRVSQTIGEVCDGASRVSSSHGSSAAVRSGPHSDVRR